MKNSITLFFIIFSFFSNAQESDKRLTPFLKDVRIIPKVANVLDFVDSSTTLKLSDNPTYFISLGLGDLKYINNPKRGSIESEGILSFSISNQMPTYKDELKSIKCYKLNDYRYLVIFLGNNTSNIDKYVLNDNAIQSDCSKLNSINENIQPLPQSTFSYSVHNSIPLLFEAASFDALEFLKIEFLND
jgi:hypothetical protein